MLDKSGAFPRRRCSLSARARAGADRRKIGQLRALRTLPRTARSCASDFGR